MWISFLPEFEPQQALDPQAPITMGAMVGPEAFAEVRFLAHYKQLEALDLIPRVHAGEFETIFGRDSGGLLKSFDAEGQGHGGGDHGFGCRHDEVGAGRHEAGWHIDRSAVDPQLPPVSKATTV